MAKIKETKKCTNKENNCDDLIIKLRCDYHRNLYHKNIQRAKRLQKTTEKRMTRAAELGLCMECAISKTSDYCDDCNTIYNRKCKQNSAAKKLSGKLYIYYLCYKNYILLPPFQTIYGFSVESICMVFQYFY